MSAGKNSTVLLRTARHCRYEQAADQNEQTACILCLQRRSVTALYRDIQPCEGAGAPPHHLTCHCEEAEGRRGNLGKAVTNSPEAFLRFGCILRDCRALLRKARNDKLGCLSHSEGRSAELASAALPCHSVERSDVAISQYHIGYHESSGETVTAFPRLPRRPSASSQ